MIDFPSEINPEILRILTDHLRSVEGEYGAEPTLPDPSLLPVLKTFGEGSSRPFTVLGDSDMESIQQSVFEDLRKEIEPGKPWPDAGMIAERLEKKSLELIIQRFQEGGASLGYAPLTPGYDRFKTRRGLDPRIGVATGKLLVALQGATVSVQRLR